MQGIAAPMIGGAGFFSCVDVDFDSCCLLIIWWLGRKNKKYFN